MQSIRAVLENQAEARGDQRALVVDDVAVTYAQLEVRTTAIANRLLEIGISRGDTVASFCDNCLETIEFWLAASKLGATYVPINAHYRGDYLLHPLVLGDVKLLLTESGLLPLVADLAPRLPSLRHVVVRDDGSASDCSSPVALNTILTATLYEGDGSDLRDIDHVNTQSPNSIIFTAGTTGAAKGVVASQHYLLTAGKLSFQVKGGTSDDVNFTTLPLFHGNAMIQSVLGPLLHGATGAIDRRFSVSRFWNRTRHHDASLVNVLGSMVQMLWNQPPLADDDRNPVRVLMGVPMPPEIHKQFEARFGVQFISSYGLAEAYPLLVSSVDDPPEPGWAGKEHDLFEVALLDDDDRPVPDGQPGEFVCRPRDPSVMFDGYHKDPESTLRATRNLWFHTGDYGVRRSDGWFAFVDRKKDAIRRRGENISSWELERAAASFSDVHEVAAFAVTSDVGEDEVMVCVATSSGKTFDFVGFMDHCVAHMPYFAVPRYVEVREDLPRSSMGKLLKVGLRERGVTSETWDREKAGYVVARRGTTGASAPTTI